MAIVEPVKWICDVSYFICSMLNALSAIGVRCSVFSGESREKRCFNKHTRHGHWRWFANRIWKLLSCVVNRNPWQNSNNELLIFNWLYFSLHFHIIRTKSWLGWRLHSIFKNLKFIDPSSGKSEKGSNENLHRWI